MHVEYDEAAHTDAFIHLADVVEEAFPAIAVDGNVAEALEAISPGGEARARAGAFEVVVCAPRADGEGVDFASVARGKTLASALALGRAPTALEVIDALERALDATTLGLDGGGGGGARCV